jgi:hypothetical protein
MRTFVLNSHGNRSAGNKWAPYFKKEDGEQAILEIWCRYSKLAKH